MAKIDALSDLCIISSCIKKFSTVAVFTEAGKCQTLFSARIASQIPASGGVPGQNRVYYDCGAEWGFM